MQRTYQLIGLKKTMETRGGKAVDVDCLMRTWNNKIQVSSGEAVTHAFVDSALRIHATVLAHDGVRQLLLLAEEHFGKKTPWDSIYKLDALQRKTKQDGNKMAIILASVADAVLMGKVTPAELSIQALTGKHRGNKGLFDYILYLDDVRQHFFRELPTFGLTLDEQVFLTKTFADVASYRLLMGQAHITNDAKLQPEGKVDLSWLARLSPLATGLFRVIEAGLHFSSVLLFAFRLSAPAFCSRPLLWF